MPFSLFITVNRLPTRCFFFHVFFYLLLILSYGGYGAQAQASKNEKVTNIGAIFDVNSRIGKEKKVAMEIAAQNFNKTSSKHKLALYFQDSGRDPFRATSSAEKMIEAKKIDVVIGMDTWQETTLVAKVGNKAQVPVISFAAPSITPPLMPSRWPFLIAMDDNDSAQINCMADLVCAYNWRKVVVIYEEDEYGGDFGSLTLLNEALQSAGSEIEYRLVLPPYSSLSNPKGVVLDELLKVLINVQSRAFIVLRSSFPMVAHLFREANKLGLVGKESVWIVTESITSLLGSANSSVISSMEGILGIKTHYTESSDAYKDFYTQFNQIFQTENPQTFKPSIHALRAYDSIRTITQGTNITTKTLLENILSSNFDGLSGKVRFQEGKLLPAPIFRIVNVIGNGKEVARRQRRYKELDFWMPQYGFLNRLVRKNDQKMIDRNDVVCKTLKGLNGSVVWPGNLNRRPKGWAMPSTSKPLRIGVPGGTVFKKFVEVDESKKDSNDGYDGFCIQIFKEVVKRLGYDLPYEFEAFSGTYPDLVDSVYNKTFDAVVGDVTILADRTEYVEFTQPYAKSGLSLIVPVKSEESAWMFMKPFTWEMWVVMGATLIYTMFILWLLEHSTNPEFGGPLKNQIGILADRTEYVEFTQPYAKSGLSLIVPVKSEESAWMFMKPFTWEMWVVMGATLIYTMFILWLLEHSTNPEFGGPLKNQIGITFWFTFSSLFYAHGERVHSNLTRVVVMVWLFVVFIISSSYTASLSSILTVRQLEPDADIESLKRTNQTVGCDGDSFVMTYLMDVLGIKEDNIIKVTDEYSYVSQFAAKNISAAILELPYEKVFLNKYCKEYTTTAATYRNGGLGFVFQKGSPIARDVSRAILSLSEDGNLTALENQWLTPEDECSNSITYESLSLKSFWGVYLISGATSTICLVLSLFRLQRNYQRDRQAYSEGSRRSPRNNKSIWDKTIGIARYYYNGEVKTPVGMRPRVVDDEWGSSRWEVVSTLDIPEHIQAASPPEIEISSVTS